MGRFSVGALSEMDCDPEFSVAANALMSDALRADFVMIREMQNDLDADVSLGGWGGQATDVEDSD